eukprot:SAG31_NODE_22835_length_517_cov_0.679426_1_plen_32_part_01
MTQFLNIYETTGHLPSTVLLAAGYCLPWYIVW